MRRRFLSGTLKGHEKDRPCGTWRGTVEKEAAAVGRTLGQLGALTVGTETNEGRFRIPYAPTGE